MTPEELMNILSQFSNTGGAQIKYYIVQSLYPDAPDCEKEKISGIYTSSYRKVKSIVEEKNLAPLKFDSSQDLTSDQLQMSAELEAAYAEATAAVAKVEELERALYEAQVQNENLTNVQSSDDVEEIAQLKEELAAAKAELEDVKGAHEFTRASMLDYQKGYVTELNAHQEAATEKHYYKYLLDRKGIVIDEAELAKVLAGEVTVEQLKKKRTVTVKAPLYGFD